MISIMRCLFLASLVLISLSRSFSQSVNLDSLTRALPASSDEKKVEILQTLIINLWLNHPDSAMRYAREAIQLANKLDDQRAKATAVRLLGGVHSYKGNFDSALVCAKESYALTLSVKDTSLMTSSLNNIGLTYYHLGSYSDALENLLRALNLRYKIGQTYGLGLTLNNIGLVYTKLKDYAKARDYFNKGLEVSRKLNDKSISLYSLNNIGFTYLEEDDLPKAEDYFTNALTIAQTIDNINWHATSYSGLGQVNFKRNNTNESKNLFKKSLALRKQIGDKNGISEVYSFFSRINAKIGKLDSAFFYLKLSSQIADQTGARERKLGNFELLKDLYAQKKQYDSALFFLEKFIKLRDSLFNENLARNLSEIQLKIHQEEARQQLAEKDVKIREKTFQTYFLIIVITLVLIFSIIFYRAYHVHRKMGQDLRQKNAEITSQKEEIQTQKEALVLSNMELEKAKLVIQDQNKELDTLNKQLQSTVDIRTKELEVANQELKVVNLELDNFIYKSSHDIKGPLVRLLGVCHVALLDIEDRKSRYYFSMLHDTAQHLNDIFDRLKIVSEINSKEIERQLIDFKKIFEAAKEHLKRIEGYDQVEIRFEINGNIHYYSDPFLMEIIWHNMMENAVRFQKKSDTEKKLIIVKVQEEPNDLVLSFVDNGIGIQEKDAEQIFRMFSKAALEHRTIGLGLYIVKQCLSKLNGSINLVENVHNFTEFEIRLPTEES